MTVRVGDVVWYMDKGAVGLGEPPLVARAATVTATRTERASLRHGELVLTVMEPNGIRYGVRAQQGTGAGCWAPRPG